MSTILVKYMMKQYYNINKMTEHVDEPHLQPILKNHIKYIYINVGNSNRTEHMIILFFKKCLKLYKMFI